MADAIAILTYHSLDESGSVVSVSPALFSAQMTALADAGWRGVSLGAAVSHKSKTGEWPDRRVVITFDDGFANFISCGLETLKRHGFGATVFVISAYVGGRNNWAPPPPGLGDKSLMSWADLARLVRAGVEIGAHTRTHPHLSQLPADSIESELFGCKQDIEAQLDQPVSTFAYPYGSISPTALACAKRNFDAACTTHLSRASNGSLEALPRIDAYYLQRAGDVVRCAEGRMDPYLAIRRWGRSARSLVQRFR